MDFKEDRLLWYTNFLIKNPLADKSAAGSGIDNNNKTKQNIQSAEELHKPIIKNF